MNEFEVKKKKVVKNKKRIKSDNVRKDKNT